MTSTSSSRPATAGSLACAAQHVSSSAGIPYASPWIAAGRCKNVNVLDSSAGIPYASPWIAAVHE